MAEKLISPEVAALLNEAVASELYASSLYKHLANQLQRIGYFGAAKHFRAEAADELEHYQRLADYFNDRGDVAAVPAIPAMTEPVGSLLDAIQAAYETEKVLGVDYAAWYAEADVTTQQFLLQFIEIQRKSVGEYGDLLARLALAGDDRAALLLIDQELGA